NSDCGKGQSCAVDGQCRDRCASDRDCVGGQRCAAGACADPVELVDGRLQATKGGGVIGIPCNFADECPGNVICLNGYCNVECMGDRDCVVTWTCQETRCHPPVRPAYDATSPPLDTGVDAIDGQVDLPDTNED